MSSSDDDGSFSSLFSSCFTCHSSHDRSLAGANATDDVSEGEVSPETPIDELEEDVALRSASIRETNVNQTVTEVTQKFPEVKPDKWSDVPEPLENCPSGLEKLYQLDTVFVRRLPPKDRKKRYIVLNDKGELLYLFQEVRKKEADAGNSHMRVYDQRMQGIWEFKRKRGETRIYAPVKSKIMKVAPNEKGLLIYQKKESILAVESDGTGANTIKGLDGKSVGKIEKLSETDRSASFPMDLLVEAKAACLVSTLLISATNAANGNQIVPIGAGPIVDQPMLAACPIVPLDTENWAPIPPPTPDCLPGLEPLIVLDRVFIYRMDEMDTRNRYVVMNQRGDRIYYLQELIPGRDSREHRGGRERALDFRAYGVNKQELWAFARAPSISDFGCCGGNVEIFLPERKRIMTIRDNTDLEVYPENIKKPTVSISFVTKTTACIKSPDGRNIGEFIKPVVRTPEYVVSWTLELPVLAKLGCLTGLFMMDVLFFDKKHYKAPARQNYHNRHV